MTGNAAFILREAMPGVPVAGRISCSIS